MVWPLGCHATWALRTGQLNRSGARRSCRVNQVHISSPPVMPHRRSARVWTAKQSLWRFKSADRFVLLKSILWKDLAVLRKVVTLPAARDASARKTLELLPTSEKSSRWLWHSSDRTYPFSCDAGPLLTTKYGWFVRSGAKPGYKTVSPVLLLTSK